MFYYRIGYYLLGEDGVFTNLPVCGEVTTDRDEAERWFANALRQLTERHWCYSVGEVRESEYDYKCWVKQVNFVCTEPAYNKGEYLLELQCYQHNPNI